MFFIYLVVLFAVVLYIYGTKNHDYWQKRGVVHDIPIPLFGTETKRFLMQRSMAQIIADVYWRFPEEKFVGQYRGNTPQLVVRDPDLIAQILVKDFKYFSARGFTPSHKWLEPLMRNLFFADGDLWRLLRTRMTGAFTSGKLKAMFPLIVERAERLQICAQKAASTGHPIDARDLMARYTTDFIGACGFGLDANSLNEDNSPFRKLGEKIINPTLTRGLVSLFKNLFPEIFKYSKYLGQELEDDFVNFSKQTLKQRNYQPTNRNDFIDYLIKWQQKKQIAIESIERVKHDGTPEIVEHELDDTLFAAQIFIFFVAGFETSSSATSFTLHQLAFNQEIQKKAQENIDKVLKEHDGKLSYDAVKEMTYLEWVFLEGMRIFPSSGFLLRQCVHKYTIPDTDVTIDSGVKLAIPIMALHNDPKYFDNPEEFRPERFSPEEVSKRHKFVYLPFGEGPRSCIGGRLGHMQSLAGLAAVLSKFTVSPAPETPRTLVSDPRSTITQTIVGGIPLVFTERSSVNML